MSVEKKFEKSFSWQTINVVTQILLQLIFISVMTRLLEREDFGILAIVLAVVGFIEIFAQIGIGPALIQRKNLTDHQISGSFWISIFLGLVFMVFLYFISPWVAGFYENDDLILLLRIIGISFIISAISIVPKSMIIKKMEFKKLFIASLIALTIGNLIIGISLAFYGFGVWAYVVALLSQNVMLSIFYWLQNPVNIRVSWSWIDVRSMLKYGGGSTLFNLFNYAASKIDVLLIGKYGGFTTDVADYSAEAKWSETGVYDRSVYLNSLPVTVLGKLSDSVMFSGLSMLQEQKEKLQKVFLTGTYFISFLVIPACVFIIAFAKEIVLIFYSEKFEDVIPIVQILFISVAFRSLIKLSDAVVRALDAVYKAAIIKFLFFLMIAFGTYFFVGNGLKAVAFVIVVSVIVQYFFITSLSLKLIQLKFGSVIKKMIPGVVIGVLVMVFSFVARLLIDTIDPMIIISLLIAIVVNLIGLAGLAWYAPWLFGKGKDNILVFALQKIPKKFFQSMRNKLGVK